MGHMKTGSKCPTKKDKFKKYKENAKTVHTRTKVAGVEDLSGRIFEEMGGTPDTLKAFKVKTHEKVKF